MSFLPWTTSFLVSMSLHSPMCPLAPQDRLFSYHIWRSRQPSPISKTQPLVLSQKNQRNTISFSSATQQKLDGWRNSLNGFLRPIPSPSLHPAWSVNEASPCSLRSHVTLHDVTRGWDSNIWNPSGLWMAISGSCPGIDSLLYQTGRKITKHFTIKSFQGRKVYNSQILVEALKKSAMTLMAFLSSSPFHPFFFTVFNSLIFHLSLPTRVQQRLRSFPPPTQASPRPHHDPHLHCSLRWWHL